MLYLKWITNKDLLYSTGNSAQCYVEAWMGGEFGEEWIHVYVWLRPFAVHLKLSQHCLLINYTPVQNFKKEKKKKNRKCKRKRCQRRKKHKARDEKAQEVGQSYNLSPRL